MRYEYKIVPAPDRGEKLRGVMGAEGRFAAAVERIMNDMAARGWEYQRSETLPSSERSGLTQTVTVWRNLLVFRRADASEQACLDPKRLEPPLVLEDPVVQGGVIGSPSETVRAGTAVAVKTAPQASSDGKAAVVPEAKPPVAQPAPPAHAGQATPEPRRTITLPGSLPKLPHPRPAPQDVKPPAKADDAVGVTPAAAGDSAPCATARAQRPADLPCRAPGAVLPRRVTHDEAPRGTTARRLVAEAKPGAAPSDPAADDAKPRGLPNDTATPGPTRSMAADTAQNPAPAPRETNGAEAGAKPLSALPGTEIVTEIEQAFEDTLGALTQTDAKDRPKEAEAGKTVRRLRRRHRPVKVAVRQTPLAEDDAGADGPDPGRHEVSVLRHYEPRKPEPTRGQARSVAATPACALSEEEDIPGAAAIATLPNALMARAARLRSNGR